MTQWETFRDAVIKPNSNYTLIKGGSISTGVIRSNGEISSGVPYTAIDLDTGDFYIAGGALTFDANPLSNSFVFTLGNMKIGRNVIINGQTKATEGIYLDNNDYWQADGKFNLGNGVLQFNGGSASRANPLTFDTGYVKFSKSAILDGVIDSDQNNYGGDGYLVLNSNGELTRGRALHYGGIVIPTSANLGRYIPNSLTGGYDYEPFRSGDIWMTVD